MLSSEDDWDRRSRAALFAVLNSRFMTWYFRAIQPRVGRLFAELNLVHLRDFPLPTAARWRGVAPELGSLAIECETSDDSQLRERIDALVESAYEISPGEQEVIRLSL